MTRIAAVVLLLALAGAAYVRLAPMTAERWHAAPPPDAPRDGSNSALRLVPGGAAVMNRLDGIIRRSPRTRVLAGSTGEGLITYVTRTRIMGFPDVVTMQQRGGEVALWSRSRFGQYDMGANAARLDDWLQRL